MNMRLFTKFTTPRKFAFFKLTVFMLVLMLEVQKGCNDNVDTCI